MQIYQKNAIARLPFPRSGDSQGRETSGKTLIQWIHIYCKIYIPKCVFML